MLRLALRLKARSLLPLGEGADAVAPDEGFRKREARFAREPSPLRLSLARRGEYAAHLFLLLPLLAALAGPALAVQPDEVMKDPALETRARALSSELRCLVCQNESIDDSEAPLARDIRILIRERIGKGESNDPVRAYLVSRYGDFILLKPPFKPETLLLWLSPVLVLGLGVAAALLRPPPRAHRDAAPERRRGSAARGADQRRCEQWVSLAASARSIAKALSIGARLLVSLSARWPLRRRCDLGLATFLQTRGRGANPVRRRVRPAGPIAAPPHCLSASSRAGRPSRRR